jgi:hypothetical protein
MVERLVQHPLELYQPVFGSQLRVSNGIARSFDRVADRSCFSDFPNSTSRRSTTLRGINRQSSIILNNLSTCQVKLCVWALFSRRTERVLVRLSSV